MIRPAALRLMELETVALALTAYASAEQGSTIDMRVWHEG
jgi:hypothetical protein